MTPAASSTVNIPFIAIAASAIRSLALGPMICTPNSLDLSFAAITFTMPSASPMVRALPLPENWYLLVIYSIPCSFACSSDNPMLDTSGKVKMELGIRL